MGHRVRSSASADRLMGRLELRNAARQSFHFEVKSAECGCVSPDSRILWTCPFVELGEESGLHIPDLRIEARREIRQFALDPRFVFVVETHMSDSGISVAGSVALPSPPIPRSSVARGR